ncbi:unnamed protein product [Brassica rapa subsp. narinosa]|uniref:RING-type E3 ubiquitin transferase n=1 Tax=Brassica napus TaxID=3708 RepID=A0A816WEK3_BRANA|nr:unnamed protein product [Brassica napus]
MDSMRADLIRGLETSLPTTFDREHFFALLVSGDVDGAEEYLSVFTTQDSNYYSNLMFYFVKRQRFFKFLVEGDNIKAGFLLMISSRPYGMMDMPIPETHEFIRRDRRRIAHEGLKGNINGDARDNGYTFDILSVAIFFTSEMFTMMNQLIPMNPDLHKKEEGEDISSQMHKLHLHDNQTTMLFSGFPDFGSLSSQDSFHNYNLDGISEILPELDRIEQDIELNYEELLIMESGLLLGGLSFYDQHRDMRLDIDNMSYEELLALEERIGTVRTALTEEAISKSLKTSIYQIKPCDHKEDAKCSICQEEYTIGDEVGRLHCEHTYHLKCVQEWLRMKSWCPICKTSADTSSSSK